MIAVKWSEFEESGCVNCGCDFCYSGGISGPTSLVVCGECREKFLVVNDNLRMSSIGFDEHGGMTTLLKPSSISKERIISNYNSEYNAVDLDGSYFLIPVSHPRKGIPKHKFVRPDVRPEDGIGDYCTPRGIGYDLACFVKSKEAGQRITDMINRVNEEFEQKGFSCRLDYRDFEPLWIQVKIKYPDKVRAFILESMIEENDNVITEDIVREANSIDPVSYLESQKQKQRSSK